MQRHNKGIPCHTAQKMKFSIKDFFSKCDQIRRKVRHWLHLLKKSLMKKFIFCVASNIYDGVFRINSQRLKAVNYFCKTLYLRCLKGFWFSHWIGSVKQFKFYGDQLTESQACLNFLKEIQFHCFFMGNWVDLITAKPPHVKLK